MQLDHEQLQQAIIGSLLLWPEEIDAVASLINVEDFHQEKFRVVFDHLLKKDGGDLVTVAHALNGKVHAADLVTWMDLQVSSVFLPRYCQELKEFANKVRLMDVAAGLRKSFHDVTLADMIDQLESSVSKMQSQSVNEPVGAPELIIDAAQRLKFRYENKGAIHGLPYGFPDLDKVTCGMHKGELIIIAGRPSMGKSAFAGNVMEHVCASGKTAMFFSLEMDRGSLVDRMLSSRGHLDFGRLRDGELEDVEWAKLTRVSEDIRSFPMFIDDTPAISLREIRSKVKKQKRHGLDLVIIDYLQLMAMPKADSRTLAVGEVSRGLKRLAREMDIPIVLLSQLSRSVESRNDKRPMMSDLRDSGEIEQDADVILFPFRPAAYCQQCKDKEITDSHNPEEHQAVAEIIVEKQRNGERNVSIPVVWVGNHQLFASFSNLPDF